MTPNPWEFGWTQVFAIAGFIVTIGIALGGFRTFGRWKREKLEERRIEVALEALAITYESKYVFDQIRSPMAFEYEWRDMPRNPGETDSQFGSRGAYYTISKRVQTNKEFFERVYKLQPRCMALFGSEAENIFLKMHRSRRKIEVSSEMLAWRIAEPTGQAGDLEFRRACERDIWDQGTFEPEKDEVGKKLIEFRTEMEALCRPVVNSDLRKVQLPPLTFLGRIFDSLLGIT